MNNLSVFIPTRNRPLQLEACLSSLHKFVRCGDLELHILSNNDPEYVDNYNLVMEAYPWNRNSYREVDFRQDLWDILELVDTNYVLCITDDTVFWRDNINFENILAYMDENPHVLTYSFRIGENCKIQDPLTGSRSLDFHENHCAYSIFNHEQFYEFNCEGKPLDSNLFYEISMDAHIYRRVDLLKICKETKFKNLREWEGNLIQNSRRKDWMFDNKRYIACGVTSAAVNLIYNQQLPPYSNNVSPVYQSASDMNKYFSEGKRIDISKTINGVPEGSHIFRQLVLY